MGFTMFALWLPSYRNSRELAAVGGPNPGDAAPATDAPPERAFPVAVVIAHGVPAVTTVVLVLLTGRCRHRLTHAEAAPWSRVLISSRRTRVQIQPPLKPWGR